jgi:hypothetical protein
MDRDNYLAIKKGSKHVVINLEQPGYWLECLKCKTRVNLMEHKKVGETGLPIWMATGMCWGFCEEHAECEEESKDE